MDKFAVVDLETTGGSAASHEIIEIGIVFIDQGRISNQWSTFVKPQRYIPAHITTLTGITNGHVISAPDFSNLVNPLYEMLDGRIFLAHNMPFDYGFLRTAFLRYGLDFAPPRACTVRYARKVVPGLRSYGLSALTQYWGLQNEARHRALGDAAVTATIFLDLLRRDQDKRLLQQVVKDGHKRLQIPVDLEVRSVLDAPEAPGVYYLKDRRGENCYIGKANNIRQRLKSHFSQDMANPRMQNWLQEICQISWKLCGSELMALLWEDMEIRKYWPPYNRAQKVGPPLYGLWMYTDRTGRNHLQIVKTPKGQQVLIRFSSMAEATEWLAGACRHYQLDPDCCGLPPNSFIHRIQHEAGLAKLKSDLGQKQGDFVILPDSVDPTIRGFIWVVNGRFWGLGTLPESAPINQTQLEKGLWAKGLSPNCDRMIRLYLDQNPQTTLIPMTPTEHLTPLSNQLTLF